MSHDDTCLMNSSNDRLRALAIFTQQHMRRNLPARPPAKGATSLDNNPQFLGKAQSIAPGTARQERRLGRLGLLNQLMSRGLSLPYLLQSAGLGLTFPAQRGG